MTEEQFEIASQLKHDIDLLQRIKVEQDAKRWINISSPRGEIGCFNSSTLHDDFRDFVKIELNKAQTMFKEL